MRTDPARRILHVPNHNLETRKETFDGGLRGIHIIQPAD